MQQEVVLNKWEYVGYIVLIIYLICIVAFLYLSNKDLAENPCKYCSVCRKYVGGFEKCFTCEECFRMIGVLNLNEDDYKNVSTGGGGTP